MILNYSIYSYYQMIVEFFNMQIDLKMTYFVNPLLMGKQKLVHPLVHYDHRDQMPSSSHCMRKLTLELVSFAWVLQSDILHIEVNTGHLGQGMSKEFDTKKVQNDPLRIANRQCQSFDLNMNNPFSVYACCDDKDNNIIE